MNRLYLFTNKYCNYDFEASGDDTDIYDAIYDNCYLPNIELPAFYFILIYIIFTCLSSMLLFVYVVKRSSCRSVCIRQTNYRPGNQMSIV